MKSRLACVLTAVLLLATVPTPAPAMTGPTFERTRVYTQCTGLTKVGNVNNALGDEFGSPWFTGQPIESWREDGAGCGVVDPVGIQDEDIHFGGLYDMVWRGEWEGNLDTLVVHAHMLGVLPPTTEIGAQLTIEGRDVTGEVSTPVRATRMADGESTLVQFAFTELGLVDWGNGRGFTDRNVRVRLFAVSPATPTIEWVWGATEFLSGLTFNGPTFGLPKVPTDTRLVGNLPRDE